MRSLTLVTLVAACSSLATAFPNPFHKHQANTTDACGQILNATDDQGYVPAKLAYDCLSLLPLNATSGKLLLKALVPWFQWQSTLTALKNPPKEYAQKVQGPVDILGGLEDIATAIDNGEYKSEYEFGWALYSLVASAHDGHFNYLPDSVGAIFVFGRKIPLVSVSEDGKKLPSVFAFPDVLGMQFKNISYTPSAVVEIDGKNAHEWLEDWAQYGTLQDRDALYNNVFYELAQVSMGSNGNAVGTFAGGGRGRYVYPGATTTLKFANGSSLTMENYARPLLNFRNYHSAKEVSERVFLYSTSGVDLDSTARAQKLVIESTPPSPQSASADTAAAGPLGYPVPKVPGPANLINGYYINAPGYEDVAVLSVPNFVGDSYYEIQFQQTTQKFLPQAAADGKKKLIIDLQANGGGTILQGYDLFKQIFPSQHPYAGTRFRAHEALDLIGQSISAWSAKTPRGATTNTTRKQLQTSVFDYQYDVNENDRPFSSWKDKYGPVEHHEDLYTKVIRWNLGDANIVYPSGGINITGYGPLANASKTQYFDPKNIVMVTDGYCASTCTIFTELMKQQVGVQIYAMGGRSNRNPIQAVGGVKGTNNYAYTYINAFASLAQSLAEQSIKSAVNKAVRPYLGPFVFNRAVSAPSVNSRDGIRRNDNSGVALQFKYEEADCRLFYTPEMTTDASAIWKAVADAKWGKKGKCVEGTYGKRGEESTTMFLKPKAKKVNVKSSVLRAFESSLNLETDCRMQGQGFMPPA